MKKHSLFIGLAAALVLSGCAIALAVPPAEDGAGFWRILDTRQVGAEAFIKAHPTWDGRGAVIAVLDTGVDMNVAGLRKTSAGKVKVIDARDFSGEGDVTLSPAKITTIDGVRYLSTDEGKVRGFDKLPIKPQSDEEWVVGFLFEKRFQNGDVPDLNRNGNTNDRFAVATVMTEDTVVAYVDLDGDNNLEGCKPIHSYGVKQETFTFHLPDPANQRPPVTFALFVSEDGAEVSFHYDDGGHGTHVAGIAAGHSLMGRKGFDGIAPGAQVMSLKIGDNTLAGGATTTDSMHRAIEYAGEWSKTHDTPVIINLSYGIGSEIEGESDIDAALDAALEKYPLLNAAVSAGNEGPGLSTVGTPAASHLATSVAAMLPKATAEALFGSRLKRHKVFGFSSRGGELAKPDVLAPGIASSSTPAFDTGDIKGGTSMAAPEIAGVYALLASAARATKTRFTGGTMKRALLHSARPIAGYMPIEQGAGVPDVQRAFEAVRKLSKHTEPFQVVGYRVRTQVPTSSSDEGPAGYWRTGTYLPPDTSGQRFSIEAVRPEGTTANDRAGFQTMLRFKSDTSWLSVDRKVGRLLGDDGLSVTVNYADKQLAKPGVYAGRVLVTPDDGAGIPATGLWSTVVVPHTFGIANSYGLDVQDSLEPCDVKRYPILVPPGASRMTVSMETPQDKWGSTTLYVYDPAGRPWQANRHRASSERNSSALATVDSRDLTPGIWEVIAYSSFRNKKPSHYKVSVRFRGFDARPITRYKTEPGKQPTGRFSVTNRYDTRFRGAVSGSVFGYHRRHTVEVTGDTHLDVYEMNDEIQRVKLVLRLDARTYNRFTDVAVTVMDEEDNALVKDGFVNGVVRLTIPKPKNGRYTLQIKGAMTRFKDKPWKVAIEETYVWSKPVGAIVDSDVVLYPNVRQPLTFYLDKALPKAPKGFVNYGELRFKDSKTSEVWLTLPMRLK